MESIIYEWIGFVLFWLMGFIGVVFVVGLSFKVLFDKLGNIFTNWWVVVDYAFHKQEFKKYMKGKKSAKDIKFNKKK